jgi:molybdopterin-guanine dinucleotide biosynthesis protein A
MRAALRLVGRPFVRLVRRALLRALRPFVGARERQLDRLYELQRTDRARLRELELLVARLERELARPSHTSGGSRP